MKPSDAIREFMECSVTGVDAEEERRAWCRFMGHVLPDIEALEQLQWYPEREAQDVHSSKVEEYEEELEKQMYSIDA